MKERTYIPYFKNFRQRALVEEALTLIGNAMDSTGTAIDKFEHIEDVVNSMRVILEEDEL